MARHPSPTALLLGLLLVAPGLRAQGGADMATRRALLVQAQEARTAGDHARALDLLRRAGRITMTSSVRNGIAEEEVALGQLAEALGSADQCVLEARREPPSANHSAVLAGCQALLAQLGPRVGRVVVRVPTPPPPGLHVQVGGHPLDEAFWGVSYVVTPGRVVVEASATDRQPFQRTVEVTAGGSADVEVALTAAAAVSPPRPPPTAVDAPPAPAAAPLEPLPARSLPRRRPVSPWGPVVFATGAAALATAGVLALVSNGHYTDLTNQCPAGSCPAAVSDPQKQSIQHLDAATTVTLIAGGGLAAVGVVMFMVDRLGAAPPSSIETPHLGFDPVHRTIGLSGTF